MYRKIKNVITGFFFPPICPFCKELKATSSYFCFSCMQTVELSLNKLTRGSETEVCCFESSKPMQEFFQSLEKEKHPNKIELAISFFLLQLHQHKIEEIELIYNPYKRRNIYSILSKNLAKKLQVPLVQKIEECKQKKVLLLGKKSPAPQALHLTILSFVKEMN